MKIVIIGLLALILLGGGGAGVYFFFMQPAEASAPELEEHEEHAKKEEKKKDDHGDGHGGKNVSFVRLEPLILPIIDGEGVSQVITLVIVLEVDDQFVASEVRQMQPRLKDAYIQEMYGVLNKQAALEGGVLKVADIKQRLNQISSKVMGDDAINDVLLEVVQQRPL